MRKIITITIMLFACKSYGQTIKIFYPNLDVKPSNSTVEISRTIDSFLSDSSTAMSTQNCDPVISFRSDIWENQGKHGVPKIKKTKKHKDVPKRYWFYYDGDSGFGILHGESINRLVLNINDTFIPSGHAPENTINTKGYEMFKDGEGQTFEPVLPIISVNKDDPLGQNVSTRGLLIPKMTTVKKDVKKHKKL